ncbi:proliferating cell nuclear antigen-like [Tachypleus tridentatus]|uniref:proliferating cell nuclear antigen-like n=1 Tax=Tachypleus tridentatus TaxID=6853 RepID=UPI003FD237E1
MDRCYIFYHVCERSINKLKPILTYPRASISQDCLFDLEVLSEESETLENIDTDGIIEEFAQGKWMCKFTHKISEARLAQGSLQKKVLEAIKYFFNEATWDFSPIGISLQAMDNSHVSLVSVNLQSDGFNKHRYDRNISMGMNLGSMFKILKCAANLDIITVKAQDEADSNTFFFEVPSKCECS